MNHWLRSAEKVAVQLCKIRESDWSMLLSWLPMERNLRKRNLCQPIKSSQLPDSLGEFVYAVTAAGVASVWTRIDWTRAIYSA